ncbi:MAG: calcium/sodium antiporter [Bacilli bacterium]|nr:calcium/sodium antiporter [Bacilli bacterium]
MDVVIIVLLFLLGLLLIIKGGDVFVDSASWIAEKSGIPKFIVGATIVSFITTLPELVASVIGTIEGSLGLAVGNAIGSVTANTGLIMAISIIFMPAIVDRKQYAFKSILLMLLTLLIGIFVLNGKLAFWQSIIIILFSIAFLIENVLSAKALSQKPMLQEADAQNNEEQVEQEEEKIEEKGNFFDALKYTFSFNTEKSFSNKVTLLLNILKFIIGGAGIYIGAKLLVDKGTELATILHISEDVIGLTMIAIGTSLPELVTTLTAIAKKQSSLSIGNIVGANIIDMSIILPICGFVSGGTLILDSMQTAYLDIPVSLGIMMIALIPMLFTKKLSRWQGILMLALYVCYLVIICIGILPW